MIYFISDTHFNHDNIIKYCNRPYKNVEEMNEDIINRWNKVVTPVDTIYHLGDLAFGSQEEFAPIVSRLNGNKILVRGNHDNWSVSAYEKFGFTVLKNAPIKFDEYKLLLSHTPRMDAEIPDGYINIHGHIHNNILEDMEEYPSLQYSPDLHFNVSSDVLNFTPISIDELLKRVGR